MRFYGLCPRVWLSAVVRIGMACTLLVANSYAQTENRLQSVAKLIESSSAATQIESSADPEAIARREDARALYRQAVEADQRGDSEGADQLLQKATQTMFEAVRLAGKDEVNGEKNRKDFALRMQSVEALMKAHQRISVEKKNGDADQFKQDIDLKLQRVQSLHDSGQLAQAREILDEVYVIAKTGIEELRDGDTLVRSLNFATKEEEYRYELDRNDTHEMLITVLLQDKMEGQKPNPMTQEFIDKATDLRFQAEKEASTGDYATAIRTLEDSTRQLVRAIRGAGIYIPG